MLEPLCSLTPPLVNLARPSILVSSNLALC